MDNYFQTIKFYTMKIFVFLFTLLNVAATAQNGGEIYFEYLNDSTVVILSDELAEPADWWGVTHQNCYYDYSFFKDGQIVNQFSFDADESEDIKAIPEGVTSMRVKRLTNFFTPAGNKYVYSNLIEVTPPVLLRDTITHYTVIQEETDVVPPSIVDYCTVLYDYNVILELQEVGEVIVINQNGYPVYQNAGTHFELEGLQSGMYYAYIAYNNDEYEIETLIIP